MNVLHLRAFRTRAAAEIEPHKLLHSGRGDPSSLIGQLTFNSFGIESCCTYCLLMVTDDSARP